MNILFLFPDILCSATGGVQRVSLFLSDYFESRGCKTYFLSLWNLKDYSTLSKQYVLPNKKNVLSSENIIFFKKFLFDKQIDVVLNQAGMDSVTSNLSYIAHELKIPIVSAIHTSPLANSKYYHLIYPNRFTGKICKYLRLNYVMAYFFKMKYKSHFNNLLKKSDSVVLLSDKFKNELQFLAGNNYIYKVISISNPITVEYKQAFTSRNEKIKEVIYVGRFDHCKKIENLLYIWRKVYKNNPDWYLTLVGDGPTFDAVNKLAKKMKLENIRFEGFQMPENYYKRASILCMTSIYEGWGLVLVEAMYNEVVPMAFNSYASADEIIDDKENGYLITPFDINEYSTKLHMLMNNDRLRRGMSFNAKKKSLKFSIDTIGEQWISHFDNLLVNYEKKSC